MNNININTIKTLMQKANLSVADLRDGPSSVFLSGKQFILYLKNDKLIIKQTRKLFANKQVFNITDLT